MLNRTFVTAVGLCVWLGAVPVPAASLGDVLDDITLRDADGKPSQIPDFGKKVLLIIYADMQAADVNDPLADAVNAKRFDASAQRGIGVANLADSWAPDFAIRMIIRRKIEKYRSTILTDDDHVLAKAWGLGDCDDSSVALVVNAEGRLLYLNKGEVPAAEIPRVVDMIEREVNKTLAASKLQKKQKAAPEAHPQPAPHG